jgi:hypothetical protein
MKVLQSTHPAKTHEGVAISQPEYAGRMLAPPRARVFSSDDWI